MKDKQKYRYKPADGLLAGLLCVPMFLYPWHSSRRIKPPETPEGHCTICLKWADYFCAIFSLTSCDQSGIIKVTYG